MRKTAFTLPASVTAPKKLDGDGGIGDVSGATTGDGLSRASRDAFVYGNGIGSGSDAVVNGIGSCSGSSGVTSCSGRVCVFEQGLCTWLVCLVPKQWEKLDWVRAEQSRAEAHSPPCPPSAGEGCSAALSAQPHCSRGLGAVLAVDARAVSCSALLCSHPSFVRSFVRGPSHRAAIATRGPSQSSKWISLDVLL